MDHPDRKAERQFQDHQKCIEVRNRVVARGAQQRQCSTGTDHQDHGHNHRKNQPRTNFTFGRIPVPGPEETPQPLPHHFEQPPPAAAGDQAADSQHHDGIHGQPTEAGEQQQEFDDVNGESAGVEQERGPQPVAEVGEDPAGEQARVERNQAAFPARSALEPAIDLVHETRFRRRELVGFGKHM
ncbi:hypothetical protein [Mycobacterium shottsii]|uniref:hypothetical protein n=1 Tax=Mycobacterium shottsii TaxID=133549 RepID=UPI0018EA192C|nr:hypothetical protein [Mycobacterium shottsii]